MRVFSVVLVACLAGTAWGGGISVQDVQGEVSVRHGVTEEWIPVKAGALLKPDDSMRTGAKASAVLVVAAPDASAPPKRIALPPEVIVDMADVRELSQEELMLKLTMEKVRASSYQWKDDDLKIPNAGVVHGSDRGPQAALTANQLETGRLQMNGTRVLFENGFTSTGILKALEVFRLYPPLGASFENRLMVAEAMERANLRGEALNEYASMTGLEGLTPEQTGVLNARIAKLRR